jgi:hypothetical protein
MIATVSARLLAEIDRTVPVRPVRSKWPGAVSGAGDAEREYNYGLTHIIGVACCTYARRSAS